MAESTKAKGGFSAYARLFRIEHAFMLSFAVLISLLLSQRLGAGALPDAPVLAAALLVPFLIEMASFALNDYFDVETDRENRRLDRPLASGEITPQTAFILSLILYAAGLALSLMLPLPAIGIAAVFALLSVAYNYRLKELPLVGNAYIAASMAIPFIFGNSVFPGASPHPAILAVSLVAFVAGLGREIAKSAEDVEGDVLRRKARTLPALIGVRKSAYAAAACYSLLVPASFIPFAYGMPVNLPALGFTALAAFSFASIAVFAAKDHGKESLAAARKASLLSLALGLVGYAASLL